MFSASRIARVSLWPLALTSVSNVHALQHLTNRHMRCVSTLRSSSSPSSSLDYTMHNAKNTIINQRRFNSTGGVVINACPFHHVQSVETVSPEVVMNHPVPHCPLIGDTPAMPCPVEMTMNDGIPVTYKTPTLSSIVQQMGKSQLSAYVASTAFAGYIIGGGVSVPVALAVFVGTLLQSYSANTANQIIEAPYDKLMKRTCRRPLPMKLVSPRAACLISTSEMLLGTGVLYYVSPLAALFGCINWILYVCMYTPLKRVSALNTWFGSIVGGIPPIMGGLAVTNSLHAVAGSVWLLGLLLFVWQIPHFNGLAFHCRRDYEAAGYKMLAFYNPWRASFYAVLLSVVMAAITLLGPYYTNTPVEWIWYYPVSVVANGGMIYKAALFHRAPQLHCRGCFVYSYLYLSVMLAAIMLNYVQPLHRINAGVEYLFNECQLVEGLEEPTLSNTHNK